MNIGELFINLGIKGADKTVGQLSDVSKGMSDVKGMSIEAKAAILGAIYALQRLTAASGQTGTGLVNLEALTGASGKAIQQWRWAMVQAGGSADEIDGILKNLQKTMAGVDFSKGTPEGFAILAKAAGGIDRSKIHDSIYMIGKMYDAIKNLDKLLPKEKLGLTNFLGQNMGLTDNFLSAAHRKLFEPHILARAHIYGKGELRALDRANILWKNLASHIEMAIGHFNAMHGGKMVADITLVADAAIKLANALLKISEQLHVFQALSASLKGIADSVDIIRAMFGSADKHKPGEPETITERIAKSRSLFDKSRWEGTAAEPIVKGTGDAALKLFEAMKGFMLQPMPGIENPQTKKLGPNIAPTPSATQFPLEGAGKTDIQQNLYFYHDTKDPHAAAESTKRAIEVAYRQIQAQGRVA